MQNLDIISINLWQILISLCNLLLLFLLLKKFLYQPVRRMMAARRAELDAQYAKAKEAEETAEENRRAWEEKMSGADAEAERVVKDATERANHRYEKIVADAKEKAGDILHDAQTGAELEYRKAQAGMREEIVDVSAALAEKLLRREINREDHRAMIDSVIAEMGEEHDGDQ